MFWFQYFSDYENDMLFTDLISRQTWKLTFKTLSSNSYVLLNEGLNCCKSYKLSDYNSKVLKFDKVFLQISVKLKLNK
jgi:hypothetical protein